MKKNRFFFNSFKNAFTGIVTALKEERNLKIEFAIGCCALIMCALFKATKIEWLIVTLCCMTVICLEYMNSALEKVVDLASPEYHPLAKKAKDFAAGAVLVAALGSAIIGITIFLPYFLIKLCYPS